MKKNKVSLIFTITLLLLISTNAFAASVPSDVLNPTGINPPANATNADVIWTWLKTIIQWTYTLFFIIGILFVLYAAFLYLTGGSNPENVKKAHKTLLWAAVAVAVALLSVGFAQIISSFITGN